MKEMELLGLREYGRRGHPTGGSGAGAPIVLLRETEGDGRVLPIFIGKAEALSIAIAQEGYEVSRPNSHDLMKNMLESLGAELLAVEIVDLEDRTFFAELELGLNKETCKISARPSDAIALAVRMNAPILAAEKVLDEAGFVPQMDGEEEGEAEPDDPDGGVAGGEDDEQIDEPAREKVIEEFKNFLSDVSADDFEKS